MPIDQVQAAREVLARSGPAGLVVDDLRPSDLPLLEWSGTPTHIRQVAASLRRRETGEVEYLAVRSPTGAPLAKCGINYTLSDDAGTLWQLIVHPELRGCGVGTHLIRIAEDRVRVQGKQWTELGVEDDNVVAIRLYKRLGYLPDRRETASWEHEDPDGQVSSYETTLTVLRKRL